MKKIFTLIATAMIAGSAFADTPYKNLYAEVTVSPAGAGYVYLDAKNEEDRGYVKEQSDDFDETAFIKITSGENGSADQCSAPVYNEDNELTSGNEGWALDASGDLGYYDVKFSFMPEEGYEFVALVDDITTDGVYTAANAHMRRTGKTTSLENKFVFHWDYVMYDDEYDEDTYGEYNLININSAEVGTNSDRGAHFNDEAAWPTEPTTKYIAVFREVGAEYPKLVIEEATGVAKVVANAEAEAAFYNMAGQKVNANAKGIVIANGKKVIK